MLSAVKDGGFIITRENIGVEIGDIGLQICFDQVIGDERIVLLRKVNIFFSVFSLLFIYFYDFLTNVLSSF